MVLTDQVWLETNGQNRIANHTNQIALHLYKPNTTVVLSVQEREMFETTEIQNTYHETL